MQKKFLAKNDLRLGANFNRETKSINFKLFSSCATDVTLCIFKKPEGEAECLSFDMIKTQNDIWEVTIDIKTSNIFKKTFYYGFRVFGPNWVKEESFTAGTNIGFKSFVDNEGNRFNPNKIAYDPYGLEISHLPSKYDKNRVNEENYMEDNSKYAPKSVFEILKDFKMPYVKNLRAPKDEIIGEVHIKDLTNLMQIKDHGTYLGAIKMAKKLKEMGFTTIEFLPLTEYDDFDNYWGYMPLSYFALSKKYSYSKKPYSALNEFRHVIKAFHENDLKVCLDMVYNHTGEARIYEGNPNDVNLMSYALIDNKTYYKNAPNNFYTCYSGCYNDFNVANKSVQDLIIDSLEFWIKQGVDMFRFDLAAALMDIDNTSRANYDKNNGFVSFMKEELEKRGVNVIGANDKKEGVFLIAEPWVCSGCDSYQLGNFPEYWGEWNDIARGTIRANTMSLNNTDPLGLRNLIEGAPFCFGDKLKTINYISSHDGFTLNDVNSYDKHCDATKDGCECEMCSSYCGDIDKQELAIKKQIALLFISKGIPMLQVGDIVAHTKLGNNNSYNMDSSINYIDFSKLKNKNERPYRVYRFITSMIKFRQKYGVLRDIDYQNKIEYYSPNATVIPNDNWNYWQNKGADFFLFKINSENNIYCLTSKAQYPLEIKLPKTSDNKAWHLILDTTKDDFVKENGVKFEKESFMLEPNSFVIFVEN